MTDLIEPIIALLGPTIMKTMTPYKKAKLNGQTEGKAIRDQALQYYKIPQPMVDKNLRLYGDKWDPSKWWDSQEAYEWDQGRNAEINRRFYREKAWARPAWYNEKTYKGEDPEYMEQQYKEKLAEQQRVKEEEERKKRAANGEEDDDDDEEEEDDSVEASKKGSGLLFRLGRGKRYREPKWHR
jgi:hypothetical protein